MFFHDWIQMDPMWMRMMVVWLNSKILISYMVQFTAIVINRQPFAMVYVAI
jgi:hypothetical protein